MSKRRTWWPHKLEKPETHETEIGVPAAFWNDWLKVTPLEDGATRLDLAAKYAYDGATLVPTLRGMKIATAFHDAVYQWAEDLAARWSWTVRDVLKFGDEVFYERMLQDGANRGAAWVYYRAVRAGGYAFHQMARRLKGLT